MIEPRRRVPGNCLRNHMDLFRGLKNTNTKPQTPAPASHPLPSSPRLRKKPLAFQPWPLVSIIPVINFLHFTGGSCQAPHCHPAAVRGAQPQGTPGCWWGGTAMPGSPALLQGDGEDEAPSAQHPSG